MSDAVIARLRNHLADPESACTYSASERAVWLALALHADFTTGDGAWPSSARLARVTGISRRTVFRALKTLERDGAIVRQGKRGPAHRETTVWGIRLPGDTTSPHDLMSPHPVTQGHAPYDLVSPNQPGTSPLTPTFSRKANATSEKEIGIADIPTLTAPRDGIPF